VTVNVNRVSDGALVASSTPTDGRFRFRLKRGLYDVSEVGEIQRVRVKRQRFTHVELRARNICIA
jgi:hypothetical protein